MIPKSASHILTWFICRDDYTSFDLSVFEQPSPKTQPQQSVSERSKECRLQVLASHSSNRSLVQTLHHQILIRRHNQRRSYISRSCPHLRLKLPPKHRAHRQLQPLPVAGWNWSWNSGKNRNDIRSHDPLIYSFIRVSYIVYFSSPFYDGRGSNEGGFKARGWNKLYLWIISKIPFLIIMAFISLLILLQGSFPSWCDILCAFPSHAMISCTAITNPFLTGNKPFFIGSKSRPKGRSDALDGSFYFP